MASSLLSPLDASLPGLGLALVLGLLIGVERGWHMREEQAGRRVAGIRTFALLGLTGGIAGLMLGGAAQLVVLLLISGVLAALLLGYFVEMRQENTVSATSTLAAMLTLGLGAMATTGHMALASVGAGSATFILGSRAPLHRALNALGERDMKVLLRLALVVFVILPLLPDRGLGPYGALNPYRLWTVVVITGGVSVLGYILVRRLGEQRGTLLAAAMGAVVSSTAVTVDGARRLREGTSSWAAYAAIAIASCIMLSRSLLLVGILAPFAFSPFAALVLPGLGVSVVSASVLIYLGRDAAAEVNSAALKPPDLRLAFLFALSVAALAIASAWAQAGWGGESAAALIAVGGLADIDAAIATVGTLPPGTIPVEIAALALAGPTLFNTLFKLALLVAIAGWRKPVPGAVALAATSLALLVPMLLFAL